jgi:hypothetical protein
MKWFEVVKSEFIKVGVNRLTNAIFLLLLLPLLSSLVFPKFFAGLSWQLYLVIVTVLSIAFASVLTAYLSLRRKYVTPFKGWTFDNKKGVWWDGQNYYCPNCKDPSKPMRVSEKGWQCLTKSCYIFMADPDDKNPSGSGSYR